MDKLFLVLFVLNSFHSTAQVQVKEIKLQVEDLGERDQNGLRKVSVGNAGKYKADVVYPVIAAPDSKISKKINDFIRAEVLAAGDSITIKSALFRSIQETLNSMDFVVTLNTKELLSLKITTEGCGAYCSTSIFTFTFNLKNGALLKIGDVIVDVASFRKIVHADKIKALNNYRQTLDTSKEDAAPVASELVDQCSKSVSMEQFFLTENELHIIDPCSFPHYLQALQPQYALVYSYKKYAKFIKIENLLQRQ